ncbi:MAG TPA: tyrosine-type recombinase/integrase [Verrucomicrobiae bacterium]|nr:tyrosine-type recombinase/integrase [Verrucomicrobiae bacterium]
MARRRHQAPKPIRYGKFWVIQVRGDRMENGKRTRFKHRIRLCSGDLPEREAQKIADEELRPLNQGLETIEAAVTSFQEYVDRTYIPLELPHLASTTRERYQGVIDNYLLPEFGKLCLRDLTRKTIQKFFSQPSTLTLESRDKIRDVLSSILRSAVEYGALVKNPVEGVRLPRDKRGRRPKPHITPEQFEQLLAGVPEPYSTMLYVAVYSGLRVSELIALRWADIHADSITIDERYCRGEFAEPKTAASNATIGVDPSVIERIQRLKLLSVEVRAGVTPPRKYQLVKSDGPDDLVFTSVRDGKPMRDNNILVRFIKPAARALGIPWVNWRCLRTSYATWMVEAGATPKAVQGQMRHSRISTTFDVYAQFVPESQREAVAKMSAMAAQRRAATASAMKQLTFGGTNWLQ